MSPIRLFTWSGLARHGERQMTLNQHIAANRQQIEKEARIYAANYGCSLEAARRDVTDEYVQGWHIEADAVRYGDFDRP